VKRSLRAPFTAMVAGLVVATLLGGTAVAAPSGRAILAGSVPPWASATSFKQAADPSANVGFRVYLGWQNEAAATALAQAVSDPRSSSYGHYLTPAQFRQQFAPPQSSVNAVQSWLRSQGFTIDYTPSNNLYVSAEGTVAQAAAAFGTSFDEYAVQGQILRSPATALTIPASLGGIVSSVVGLDESAALVHTDHVVADATPPGVFLNAPPCSAYWGEKTTANTTSTGPTTDVLPGIPTGQQLPGLNGQPVAFAPCGYTPPEIRAAYGLGTYAGGLTGKGVTVAVIDAYAIPQQTIFSDVNTYAAAHGIPPLSQSQFTSVVAPGTYKRPENPRQGPQGWSGEETLDLEAVHGMAPDAHLVYVGAPNNYQDLDAALNHVVNRHLADIVTNSYGWSGEALPAGFITPVENILVQAAVEGITVTFSSGDSGDETSGTSANFPNATPDWPASSPLVTAVGGTSIGIGTASDAGAYDWETGWETGRSFLLPGPTALTFKWGDPAYPGQYLYGSGGGTSRLFTQPSYQAGVVPAAMATANGARPQAMRVVPDVAAIGDPNTGMLVGQTQLQLNGTVSYSEYRIGGTSLSSPIFAGTLALVDQQRATNGLSMLGFANPALYAVGSLTDMPYGTVPQAVVRNDTAPTFTSCKDSNGVSHAIDGNCYTLRSIAYDGLTIHTVAGYDDVTGLGTPNGQTWLGALASYSQP